MSGPGVQAARVVLLTKDDSYFEVLSNSNGHAEVMGPAGAKVVIPLAEAEAAGYAVKVAHKLIKTDGSWLYMTAGQYGTDIYGGGKYSPAHPLGMQKVRTL
jgi:hypothetical protein